VRKTSELSHQERLNERLQGGAKKRWENSRGMHMLEKQNKSKGKSVQYTTEH
jgi:hypothetical protein